MLSHDFSDGQATVVEPRAFTLGIRSSLTLRASIHSPLTTRHLPLALPGLSYRRLLRQQRPPVSVDHGFPCEFLLEPLAPREAHAPAKLGIIQ